MPVAAVSAGGVPDRPISAVFVRLLQAPAAKAVRQAVLIRARRAERAKSVRMGTSSLEVLS
jgi:hypothetical protein